MPRISRELAAKKESFVAGLFATNPALTIREVQDALKTEFNQTMNPATIIKLKGNLTNQDSPIVVAGETATLAQEHAEDAPVAVVETVTVTEGPVTTVGELAAEEVVRQTRAVKEVVFPDGTIEREIRPGLVEVIRPSKTE